MGVLLNNIYPDEDFVRVSNYLARTDVISHKARGMLMQLRSHVNGWTTSQEHLIATSKEGRTAIHSGLKELEDNGFLVRIPIRDEKQRIIGSQWYTTDDPIRRPIQMRDFPHAENLQAGKPAVGEPTT